MLRLRSAIFPIKTALFCAAITYKEVPISKTAQKNPGTPPLAVRRHNRKINRRGELGVIVPPRAD